MNAPSHLSDYQLINISDQERDGREQRLYHEAVTIMASDGVSGVTSTLQTILTPRLHDSMYQIQLISTRPAFILANS